MIWPGLAVDGTADGEAAAVDGSADAVDGSADAPADAGAIVGVEPEHALAANTTTVARAANRVKLLLPIRLPFLSPW
jgi:hypothetical protein